MQIRDAEIIRLIQEIGEHYRTNISNRFLRPALLQLSLDKQSWDLIETLMEKADQYQDFDLEDLYKQIAAIAQFVSVCRRDLLPNLRARVSSFAPSGSDRVLWDIAVNNFTSNLGLFADLMNMFYVKLVDLDKVAAQGHRPLYMQLPQLKNIGRLLVGV